ncbi:MAG: TonB-dependent receptor [Myxococcaceae bacterium]|jgi:vitamin B12 transporter|nr:TonB-dependent receptor [Myxococcaceae bacterium]MCA3013222.1 TonB-dependent receptor [Myxococcaceae bacterium]
MSSVVASALRSPAPVGLALWLALWSAEARAEAPDAGAALSLPPVRVTGPGEAPAASSPLVRDPGALTTVVPARGRAGEVKDASELVAASPGAVVQDQGGAGQRKTLSLRGASPNGVLVLLDGVPLNAPGNAVDLSRLPVAMLDRVEVLRGAGSRYGPGAMGGVVNLVTRAPGPGARVFADVSQGSFWTTTASLGGATTLAGGDALALVHGLRSDGDFTYRWDDKPALAGNEWPQAVRQNNAALQGGGLVRWRRAFGATRLDVLAEGLFERRGLAGPVQNPTVDAAQQTGRGTVSARAVTAFDDGGELQVLGFGRLDATLLRGSPFGLAPLSQLETSAGAEAVYTRRALGRHRLTGLLSGGGDFLREPTGLNPAWGRLGAMVGDEVSFFDGRLLVDGSARVDVAGPFVVLSPKLAVTALLPRGFELRASGGQAARPPGFQELYVVQGTLLPNPELRPERGLLADVSAAWRASGAAVQVTGFAGLYENLIAYELYPPTLARPYNFAAASVMGAEVEGALTPAPWLEAQASYTFMATQNLKDDPRYYLKALPYRPRHRVTGRVVAGPDWLRARAEVLVQSEQFVNRTEAVALPARAFVNVGIAAMPWKNPRVTLAFDVKNVLDVQSQDVDGYPLPPRAAFLSLGVAVE